MIAQVLIKEGGKQRRDGRRWGGEKGSCDGLYVKCPSQAMCLNTWSLPGGAVWAGYGGP